MTRFPAVGGGGGEQPIASKDRAETFAESDVTVDLQGTQRNNGHIEIAPNDFTDNGEAPANSTKTVSWEFSESNELTLYTSAFTESRVDFGDLRVNGNVIGSPGNSGVTNTYDVSGYEAPLSYELDVVNSSQYDNQEYTIEADSKAFAAPVRIEWAQPEDVYRWDAATFQSSPDGETVGVYVEESTDGGSTWTEIQGPISRGDQIEADPGSRVRFRVELARSDTSNNPTLDAIYRRWVV